MGIMTTSEIKLCSYHASIQPTTGPAIPWTRVDLAIALDGDDELPIDVEFSTQMSRDPAGVVGWCRLEARADGLWAVNVRWRLESSGAATARRYSHLVPALQMSADHRVQKFIGLGLTNEPIPGFLPIEWGPE